MADNATVVAGITIPSDSPLFLAVVGLHVVLALVCLVVGFIAMLSAKVPGRHPRYGTFYCWSLLAVFATSTVLSAMRWAENYPLFIVGVFSVAAAFIARTARRQLWRNWLWFHIVGMGTSYVLLLTAFYVDNGKNLPVWRELPPLAYWLLPAALGLPLVVRALLVYPMRKKP